MIKVLFIIFTLFTVSLFGETYEFEGTIKEIRNSFPYPGVKGFRCKISIDREYNQGRYLAYPLMADEDSKWMCSLAKGTTVEIVADRKMGKDGKWQDKGKVISMKVISPSKESI